MNRTDFICASDAATSDAAVTYWVGPDGSDLDMAGFTASEALAELLAQCGTDRQRHTVLAGRLVVAARHIA